MVTTENDHDVCVGCEDIDESSKIFVLNLHVLEWCLSSEVTHVSLETFCKAP